VNCAKKDETRQRTRLKVEQKMRGGSWINNAQNCRSAYRNSNPRDNRNNNLGLRLLSSCFVWMEKQKQEQRFILLANAFNWWAKVFRAIR